MAARGESEAPRTGELSAGSGASAASHPSDAWFRSVVEAANEGIWIIDLEAKTIFANERMAGMLGTTPERMIGTTPFDYLFEEDRMRGAEVMARNFEGVPVEFEIRFRRQDGGEIPVLAGSAPLRDEDGRITGSVATFSDLTARKDFERTLERTTAQFQALADNIPTLCWMAQADGHIYWYNKRWYDYTGTSLETQEGWRWESVHDPAVLPQVRARWQESLATGSAFEMTFPLRGADGQFRPFLTRVVPIRGDDGAFTHWFGANTNVDALSRVQDELRESRAKLAEQVSELNALYESAPIGLAFFSRDYRYLRVNDELAAINGVAADDHLGRTVRDILGDYADSIEPAIAQVFATGEALGGVEASGVTPDKPGIQRHWLAGFYPVRSPEGAVDAVGAWVIEISERKAAEQREMMLAREVDHRAKNLLAVVQSIVQLTPPADEAALKASIIGRIPALARAHSLLSDARWDGVRLDDLVREELAPFRSPDSRRIHFEGPSLLLGPAAAQSIALVLHELATNAVKYGALSRRDGMLDVRWSAEAGKLALEWVEQGGPAAPKPAKLGFGSRIIRNSVERQLRGRVTKRWLPDGLQCCVEIPLEHVMAPAER